MKYAVPYYRDFKYLKDVDEVIIHWSIKDDIVDYAKSKYAQDQRIIISFTDKDMFEFNERVLPILLKLKKEHNNFSMRFDEFLPNKETLDILKENEIRFYFSQLCNSWDILYGLSLLGASDVIITEELCFDIVNVSAFCKPRGIKVRVYPNVAQYNGHFIGGQIPDMVKFFVRPEDTPIYEPFVDVFEIWGDFEKLSVLFEIYKQQQWLGKIGDIVIGFNDDVPNPGIMTHFAGIRINCKKKCLQGKKCDICRTMKEIAIKLDENDLRIESERKSVRKEENN